MGIFRRDPHEDNLFRLLDALERILATIPRERVPREALQRFERAHAAIFETEDPQSAIERARTLLREASRFAEVTKDDAHRNLLRALATLDRLDDAAILQGVVTDAGVVTTSRDIYAREATAHAAGREAGILRRRSGALLLVLDQEATRVEELAKALDRASGSSQAPLAHTVDAARDEIAALRSLLLGANEEAQGTHAPQVRAAAERFESLHANVTPRLITLRRRIRELERWVAPLDSKELTRAVRVLGRALEPVRRAAIAKGASDGQAVLSVLRGILVHPSSEVRERIVQEVFHELESGHVS